MSSAKEKDVIDVLKHLFREDDDLDSLLEEMFHIGGAMFLTATHLIMVKPLIQIKMQTNSQNASRLMIRAAIAYSNRIGTLNP